MMQVQCVGQNIFVVNRKWHSAHCGRASPFPNEGAECIGNPEDFVHQQPQRSHLVFVNADENDSVTTEKLTKNREAGIHHAEPFVMPGEISSLFTNLSTQPMPNLGAIYSIVENPVLITGVIGRVYIDALH